MTLCLSLHHLINSCWPACAASFICIRAEYELKLEDGPSNYLLFRQGQHSDSEETQYQLVTVLTDSVRHSGTHTVKGVLCFVWSLQLKLSFSFVTCAIMAQTIKTECVRSLR